MSASVIAKLRDRLRECRAAAGFTQAELAGAAMLSTREIERLEAGRLSNPGIKTVWALAKAVGVSPAYLLGLDALSLHSQEITDGR